MTIKASDNADYVFTFIILHTKSFLLPLKLALELSEFHHRRSSSPSISWQSSHYDYYYPLVNTLIVFLAPLPHLTGARPVLVDGETQTDPMLSSGRPYHPAERHFLAASTFRVLANRPKPKQTDQPQLLQFCSISTLCLRFSAERLSGGRRIHLNRDRERQR